MKHGFNFGRELEKINRTHLANLGIKSYSTHNTYFEAIDELLDHSSSPRLEKSDRYALIAAYIAQEDPHLEAFGNSEDVMQALLTKAIVEALRGDLSHAELGKFILYFVDTYYRKTREKDFDQAYQEKEAEKYSGGEGEY